MKKMNKRTIGLVAAALMLVATIGVGSALAYFTTYTVANGGKKISLDFTKTEVKEEVFFDGRKEIIITNSGKSDCYVRVKALVGDKHPVTYSEPKETKGNWDLKADEYYEYSKILAPGESTTQIDVLFSIKDQTESFNVIIVQESTPVLYKADGTPYADWSVKAEIAESYDVAPLE